jgi:hypothetical protein
MIFRITGCGFLLQITFYHQLWFTESAARQRLAYAGTRL